jgi:hypothetical protein
LNFMMIVYRWVKTVQSRLMNDRIMIKMRSFRLWWWMQGGTEFGWGSSSTQRQRSKLSLQRTHLIRILAKGRPGFPEVKSTWRPSWLPLKPVPIPM